MEIIPLPQRKPRNRPSKIPVGIKIQPNNNNPKNGRKRRNRRAKGGPNTSQGNYKTMNVYPMIQAPGTSSGKIEKFQMSGAVKQLRGAKISQDGLAFLKCAFAPPDFNASEVKGFPDDFDGMSLVKKHRNVAPLNFSAASTDYYVLLLPVPGYAYFLASVPAGTQVLNNTNFTGIPYSDTTNLFNSGGVAGSSTSDKVSKFRFVSNHVELVPTVNAMQWTGSIQAWRLPVALNLRQSAEAVGSNTNLYSITGLQGCNSTNVNQYSGPFNLGVYTAGYNAGGQCEFQSIPEGWTTVPSALVPAVDFGFLTCPAGFTGLDGQFDSVCIKISGMGTNILNSCLLKTWACVEYQVVPNTDIYEYQSLSPCDPIALELYRKVIRSLPTGVAFVDNDTFWQRVLQIIRGTSKAAMALPGNAGLVAGGVYGLSSAMEGLLF